MYAKRSRSGPCQCIVVGTKASCGYMSMEKFRVCVSSGDSDAMRCDGNDERGGAFGVDITQSSIIKTLFLMISVSMICI